MKLDRAQHAPTTRFLLETSGEIQLFTLFGWSPLGRCVLVQTEGTNPRWLDVSRTHPVEILFVTSPAQYDGLLAEARKRQEEAKEEEAVVEPGT